MRRLVTVLFAAAVTVTAFAPAAGAATAGTWTQVRTLPGTSDPAAVSCPQVNWCMAVGGDTAQLWTGAAWVALPKLVDTTLDAGTGLAIDCTGITDCMAVGSVPSTNADPAEYTIGAWHWNGALWQAAPLPADVTGSYGLLSGVSCPAPGSCVAVGYFRNGGVALHWDGSTVTRHDIPSPVTPGGTVIGRTVSCAAVDSCVAVGTDRTDNDNAVTETWDGTTWTATESPEITDNHLFDVSCPSPSWCMAMGYPASSVSRAAAWDGTSWTSVPMPVGGASVASVAAVDCVSTAHCVAVGETLGDREVPLRAIWDGAAWSESAPPSTAPPLASTLRDVDCADATHCMAVGTQSETRFRADHDYAETWTA